MKRQRVFAVLALMSATISATAVGRWWGYRQAGYLTYHLKNGLTVEVLPMKPSERADDFCINRRNFHITMPPHAHFLRTRTEIWIDDTPFPISQGEFGSPFLEKDFDASLCVMRTNGDKGEPLRRLRGAYKYGHFTVQADTRNPFYSDNKMVVFNTIANDATIKTDDDGFVLMQGYLQSAYPGDPISNPSMPKHTVKLVVKWTTDYEEGPRGNRNAPKPGFWQSLFAGRTN